MKNSEKIIISEGVFNWLLKTLLGRDTATKLRYYAAIKTDRKLMKLSKQLAVMGYAVIRSSTHILAPL